MRGLPTPTSATVVRRWMCSWSLRPRGASCWSGGSALYWLSRLSSTRRACLRSASLAIRAGFLRVDRRQAGGVARSVVLGRHVDDVGVLRLLDRHVVGDVLAAQVVPERAQPHGGRIGDLARADHLDVVEREVVRVVGAGQQPQRVQLGADRLAEQQLGRRVVRVARGVRERRGGTARQQRHEDDDPRAAPQHAEQRNVLAGRRFEAVLGRSSLEKPRRARLPQVCGSDHGEPSMM